MCLSNICKPNKNDVVVVTTAAGSVGSAVGQLAKIYGCRTIGLTSSNKKAAICKSKFGYDEVIIDVDGANELTIRTDNGGDNYGCDHPAIAGPMLSCTDGMCYIHKTTFKTNKN